VIGNRILFSRENNPWSNAIHGTMPTDTGGRDVREVQRVPVRPAFVVRVHSGHEQQPQEDHGEVEEGLAEGAPTALLPKLVVDQMLGEWEYEKTFKWACEWDM
jgi:hypothetical protein